MVLVQGVAQDLHEVECFEWLTLALR